MKIKKTGNIVISYLLWLKVNFYKINDFVEMNQGLAEQKDVAFKSTYTKHL